MTWKDPSASLDVEVLFARLEIPQLCKEDVPEAILHQNSYSRVYEITFNWNSPQHFLSGIRWQWKHQCLAENYSIFTIKVTSHERHGMSSHWQRCCLFNCLFRCTLKKTSTSTLQTYNIQVTGPLWGNPPVTSGFPSQRASNVESVFTSYC